jgi:hypothetical protein
MSFEAEFTDTLRGTYDAARKRGYVATYFLQMLKSTAVWKPRNDC